MANPRRLSLPAVVALAGLSASCAAGRGPAATPAVAAAKVAASDVRDARANAEGARGPGAAGAPNSDAPATPAGGDPAAVADPAATGAATLRAAAAAVAAAAAPVGNVAEQLELPGALGAHELALTVLAAPSHLFFFADATVLTDPGASTTATPPAPDDAAAKAPEARAAGAGLDAALAQLPRLDAVVLSRNDAAHLDAAMARRLWHSFRPDFVVPAGGRARLVRAGVPGAHVFERRAWQSVKLARGTLHLSYVPTEAAKKGPAGPPAMGVVFRAHGHDVLFVAHGQLGHHFQAIHNRFGSPAVSVLPVAGATTERAAAPADALAPREAVLVHRLLNSELAVGSPAGAPEPASAEAGAAATERARALREAQAVHGIAPDCFVSPQPFRTLRVALDRPGPCTQAVPGVPPAPAASPVGPAERTP